MRRRAEVAIAAMLLGAAAIMLASCSSEGTGGAQLSALAADPMADYQPPGSRVIDERSVEERAGGSFSKQREARRTRRLVLSGADPVAALRRAVGAARMAGWDMGEPIADGAVGRRQLPTGRATLTIAVSAGEPADSETRPVMTIALVHHR